MGQPWDISSVLETTQQRVTRFFNRPTFRYQVVGDDEKTDDDNDAPQPRSRSRPSNSQAGEPAIWTAGAIVLVIVLALIFMGYLRPSKIEWQPHQHQHHKIRLLIPSAVPDSETCKTILSSTIMGYPMPEMVRYSEKLELAGKETDRERSKVKILSDYLNKQSINSNNDMVVVLDNPYSWVQLRLEVLLERYFSLNQKANEKLRRTYSFEDVTTRGVRQAIIMSAGKTTNGTLNGVGTIIGSVSAMRTLFREAHRQINHHLGNTTSSEVLARIYQRQEAQRAILLQEQSSSLRKAWQRLTGSFKSVDNVLDHPGDDDNFEFGIGLDSTSEIGMLVDDTTQYRWRGRKTPGQSYSFGGKLPTDLSTSTPPFWTPSGAQERVGAKWEEVRLLEDKASGNIPAFINFPWNMTNFQRDDWTLFWMQPYAQALLNESFTIPRLPVASVAEPNGIEHTFWDSSIRYDRDGVHMIDGSWVKWADICDRNETFAAAR